MAQPSSSHRERERDRDRDRGDRERERSERTSSRHHHHRTISSTTLLLVLSLVLAVLAVMLSLPATQGSTGAVASTEPTSQGVWGIFSPKRSQALINREKVVAEREAEVARREAELLAGAPGGVLPNQAAPVACPICPTVIEKVTEPPLPAHTVIKEVVKEESLAPPGWWDQARVRAEDILDRELKIAEREREISRREEAVNRREHDASRRESWIMEQLVVLNDQEPAMVEEEYIYEPAPPVPKRKAKGPVLQALPPPVVYTETAIEIATETKVVTQTQHHTVNMPIKTVTVPAPANTRIVASPAPESMKQSATAHIPRTTAVQIMEEVVQAPAPVEVIEEEEEEEVYQPPPMRASPPRRRQQQQQPPHGKWLGW